LKRASCLLFSGLLATLLGAQPVSVHGVRPGDLDPSTAPCQDFFQYANGGWLKTHPIPADHASWAVFDEVEERNLQILRQVLEDAAASRAPRGSVPQKVGAFYASGMDNRAIEKAGLAPLKAELARLGALTDTRGLAAAVGRLHLQGVRAAFSFSVGQDDKRSTDYVVQLEQGGLGLPDRDYYDRDDAQARALRATYRAYLAQLLVLTGESPALAKAHAHLVFDLEKRLALASMTGVERRDPQATYTKVTPAELRALAPDFPWEAYAGAVGLKDQPSLVVRQPRFFQELSALVRDTPLAQWRTYLKVRLVEDHAPWLSPAFEKAHFGFHEATLGGATEQEPRWQRVVRATDRALGEALGQMFVARAFSPRAKARAQDLVAQVRAALRDRIKGLDWMTEPTKAAALHKLEAMRVKVGYPDAWRDYTALQVQEGGFVAKLGRPIDRGEWDMSPPTVNAYYNPQMNEIVLAAGILQPPFFDAQADDAANYGAIGMIIGHELTHGFDDQGCQYDAEGNLRDWWTDADRKAYAARTDLVVAQYDLLEAVPGVHLNGRLTLGENIADLGGLKLAYAALARTLEGREQRSIGGFTPWQRFFLGYAQSWGAQARDEDARMQAVVNPHSPAKVRVNAPLANLPEFAEAFGCKAEGPMHRPLDLRPTNW